VAQPKDGADGWWEKNIVLGDLTGRIGDLAGKIGDLTGKMDD